MDAKKKTKRRKAREWCINAPPSHEDGLMNCEIVAGGRIRPWEHAVVVREVLPRKRKAVKRGR